MTPLSAKRRAQALVALAQGEAIRRSRAAQKAHIRNAPNLAAARRLLAELIYHPPGELESMAIYDLLIAARNHGRGRVLRLLTTAKVGERTPVAKLTHRQRTALVGALLGGATVLAVHGRGRDADPEDDEPRSAKIFELRRDRNDRPYWHQVDTIEECRRAWPITLLSIWIAETEPDPGSYRIEVSDGGWSETHYAVRAA